MTGPTPPIIPDRPDQEKVRLPSSEARKEIRKKYFYAREEVEKEPNFVFAWLVGIVKKVFDFLTPQKAASVLAKDAVTIRVDLKKTKKYLEQLKERDESENPLYIEKLSSTWDELHDLIEHGALIEPSLLAGIQTLATAFKNYPAGAIHSFHFYLIEHAGMSWFPFPFIEMLKLLHKEAQQAPEECTLQKWIEIIDHTFR